MYEISLVPDVKAELLRKQRLRNLFVLICVGVAIACGAVVMILLSVMGRMLMVESQYSKS